MPARTAPWLPLGWNSEILVEDRDFSCNLHFAIIFRMEKLEYIWGFQIVKKRWRICLPVQAWRPYLKKDIFDLLEKVQKRATRLTIKDSLSYEKRLQRLSLRDQKTTRRSN